MKSTSDLIPETSKKRDSIIDLGQENKNLELRILKVSAEDPISKPRYRPKRRTHTHIHTFSNQNRKKIIKNIFEKKIE